MDFFEAQARAKKRTSRLVLMFVVAVIGTIIAMYAAALMIMSGAREYGSRRSSRHNYYYSDYTPSSAPLALWQPQLFGGVTLITLAVVGFGSLYKWSQFSAGGKAVAETVGGRRVDPNTTDLAERRLLNVVEEMAIASGVPVPAVYILDEEPAINAFAAGLTTSDAVVTVTRGTLEKLTREELQGVIGHEFSHILNGDMRLNLRIAATIFGILVLGIIGRGILWSLRNTRVRGRNNGGAIAAILAIGVALVVIGYVGYFFGRLIQAAVSRQREFLADASSVQFTRNPGGITGALKKIGGFSLGSTMHSNQSAAIGHFFFAQAFATGFTGLWATHPPLDARIRAIDPRFDGKFIELAEGVDIEGESSPRTGLAPSTGRDARPFASGRQGLPPLPQGSNNSLPPVLSRNAPLAAIGAIGVLTPEQISNAQALLDSTPSALRTASQSRSDASVMVCGLLLDDKADIRGRQREIVAARLGTEAQRALDRLEPSLRDVRDEHRLPLVQVAMPVLREASENETHALLTAIDELVRADGRVTAFEYAMQKLIGRTLALSRAPTTAIVQIYSFNAVVDQISVVLSVLASASTSDAAGAADAFAAGAAQIKLIESQLQYLDESRATLAQLDVALDKLATSSLPIKQRTLIAAAHVVQADGKVLVCEFELLRAIAATLDVPMPLLATAAA